MKLTKETLKRIIKEELERVMMENEEECPPEHKQAAQEWANGLFTQLKGSEFTERVVSIGELKMDACRIDDNYDETVWEVSFEIPFRTKDSASAGETINLHWRSNGEHTAQEGNEMNDPIQMDNTFDWIEYAIETAGYTMSGPFTGQGYKYY